MGSHCFGRPLGPWRVRPRPLPLRCLWSRRPRDPRRKRLPAPRATRWCRALWCSPRRLRQEQRKSPWQGQAGKWRSWWCETWWRLLIRVEVWRLLGWRCRCWESRCLKRLMLKNCSSWRWLNLKAEDVDRCCWERKSFEGWKWSYLYLWKGGGLGECLWCEWMTAVRVNHGDIFARRPLSRYLWLGWIAMLEVNNGGMSAICLLLIYHWQGKY